MSRHPIRTDKTCLNCRHVVENRFCPNCGQENTETRKTFHHLFVHFFEDLTHYENAFWKTIRNLIVKPGSLTKAYLSGKRMSYLAPVRLYIFISFVTFLIIALLPDSETNNNVNLKTPGTAQWKNYWTHELDSIRRVNDSLSKQMAADDKVHLGNRFYGSQRELDSVQRFGKPQDRFSPVEYWFASRFLHVIENNTRHEIKEKFKESLSHNFPKVLFIYMPLFALVLWLFHSKKRWYYFDHGIFTLHYFSFLLLLWLVFNLFSAAMQLLPDHFLINLFDVLASVAMLGYMFYYFFPAHHRFYGGKRRETLLLGIPMLIVNSFFAGIIMLFFVVYTFLNIK